MTSFLSFSGNLGVSDILEGLWLYLAWWGVVVERRRKREKGDGEEEEEDGEGEEGENETKRQVIWELDVAIGFNSDRASKEHDRK